MFKKIFIVLVVVLILGGVTWSFFLLQKKETTAPVVEKKLEVKQITDERIVSPTASLDNNAVWFFNTSGHLFRVDLSGNNLTEYPLEAIGSKSLTQVTWPQSGSDFIVTSPGTLSEDKGYYNSESKKYITLPVNVKKFDWLPDGKRIAYVWQPADKKSQQLVVANADTTGFRIVAQVQWPDLAVKVSPGGDSALMWRTKIEGDTNSIYLINLQTGTITTIVESGKNLAAEWLSSDKFIFSRLSEQTYPRLYMYNLSSQLQTDLNINTTLERTVLAGGGEFLFAAVNKSDNTGDYFIKLDQESMKQEIYFEPVEETRVREVFYLGNTLFFVSAKDGKLYSVSK
jgi:hypothetical protein